MSYFSRFTTILVVLIIVTICLASCSTHQTGNEIPSASSATSEENAPSQEVTEGQVADTPTPRQNNEVTTCTIDDLTAAVNGLVGRSIYDHGISQDTYPKSENGPKALADMLPSSCIAAGSADWTPYTPGNSGDVIVEISDGVSFYDVEVEFSEKTGNITTARLAHFKRNMPEDQMLGASYDGFHNLCDPDTKTYAMDLNGDGVVQSDEIHPDASFWC